MSVVAVGANHHTAPLALLELMTVDAERMAKSLDDLVSRDHISEAVIVSTCNRTEIFVAAERFHGAYQDVRDFLSDLTFLPPDEFVDHLSVSHGAEAVAHLFRIGAGLDSVVIGEHEILGQIRDAWDVSRSAGASGPTLNLAFRTAIEVGKRARSETSISRHVTSVSHAAVIMAAEQLGTLDSAAALVVGAGSMARGVVDFLIQRGVSDLAVLNRTASRANELVAAHGTESIRGALLSSLIDELVETDVAFCATSAQSTLLGVEQMTDVMARRGGRPLLVIDIAMPRNVEHAVASIDGVTLLDMDALREFSERGMSERRREIPAVEAIVEQELERYETASSAREVAPLIIELRDRAQQVVELELAKHAALLDAMEPSQRDAVEAVVRSAVAKLLHSPTVQLKDAAGTLRGERLAGTLRELFDL